MLHDIIPDMQKEIRKLKASVRKCIDETNSSLCRLPVQRSYSKCQRRNLIFIGFNSKVFAYRFIVENHRIILEISNIGSYYSLFL
jgi:hypothetical protein